MAFHVNTLDLPKVLAVEDDEGDVGQEQEVHKVTEGVEAKPVVMRAPNNTLVSGYKGYWSCDSGYCKHRAMNYIVARASFSIRAVNKSVVAQGNAPAKSLLRW